MHVQNVQNENYGLSTVNNFLLSINSCANPQSDILLQNRFLIKEPT